MQEVYAINKYNLIYGNSHKNWRDDILKRQKLPGQSDFTLIFQSSFFDYA